MRHVFALVMLAFAPVSPLPADGSGAPAAGQEKP
jgi:hypothetical protein